MYKVIDKSIHFCRTYLWFDEKGKKTRVAAPQYIDYVMTFTQRTVSDETIFPTKYGKLYFILQRTIIFSLFSLIVVLDSMNRVMSQCDQPIKQDVTTLF